MTSQSNINPKIIYEDDLLLAVNKPPLLVVHGDGKTDVPTLTDWLIKKYPNLAGVGEPWVTQEGKTIARPGIVHRLDRETSGVMVVAKTQEAFLYLKQQFLSRKIEKKYHAFVYGILKEKSGVIDLPIGKSTKDFRKRSAEFGARGTLRDAVTAYEVLKEGIDASYLLLTPRTGRTHQIRVHLKAIGHPVVKDDLYAPKRAGILGFTRLALHAHTLSLVLPDGVRMTFEAPLPPDFEQALSEIARP